jgi:uncharacterized protein YjbI with pentapeptide repeats
MTANQDTNVEDPNVYHYFDYQWENPSEDPKDFLHYCKKNNYRADFSHLDLSYAVFNRMDIDNVCFANTTLCHAQFYKSTFSRVDFTSATLDRAYFSEAIISNCTFDKAKMIHTDFEYVLFEDVTFRESNCMNANFYTTWLIGVDLTKANLTSADLSAWRYEGLNLTEVIGFGTREKEVQFAQWLLDELSDDTLGLEMDSWHTCDTTHCLAGHWDNNCQNGKKASTQLPTLARYFYDTNEEALAALQRVANGEESVFDSHP